MQQQWQPLSGAATVTPGWLSPLSVSFTAHRIQNLQPVSISPVIFSTRINFALTCDSLTQRSSLLYENFVLNKKLEGNNLSYNFDMVVVQSLSCLTLTIPWTVAHQASLSMGFSGQEYWSGIIREMQIKTTMRYHYRLVRMAAIKKSTNNKC